MIQFRFFFRYALKGLMQGGQRVVIAILAVAFGVMSLITMSSVSNAINRTINTDARIELGGDVRLTLPDGRFSLEALDSLPSAITYTPVSRETLLLMRKTDSGRVHFIQYGLGIDPSVYPLAGEFKLQSPSNISVSELLQETGSILVTRDLMNQHNLEIGDELRLAYADGTSIQLPVTIRGVLSDTPNHYGNTIFYNLQTAQLLIGSDAVFNYVVAQADEATALQLESAGWRVEQAVLAEQIESESTDFFNLMLKGAGILGLIVGGIGIANTMQVLLSRRQQEVGILKTLGCSQQDMMTIFLIEAGMLGVIGSFTGVIMALFVSQKIIELFANISTLLIAWQFDFPMLIGGFVAGVITTLIFALYAIVRTSNVRPTIIFRRESVNMSSWKEKAKAIAFYALLSLPFAVITSLILGSVVQGIGILLFALVSLIAFSIVLGIFTWIMLRIMPVFNFNLLRMARNNMRKRAFSMMFAMIALFVGIFTLGFAATIIQVGFDELAIRQDETKDYNMLIYTNDSALSNMESLLIENGAEKINNRYIASIDHITVNNTLIYDNVLQVRDAEWDFEVTEGDEFGSSIGVYLPYQDIAIGEEIIIHLSDKVSQNLPVLGYYTMDNGLVVSSVYEPIITRETLDILGIPINDINLYAMVPMSKENEIATLVGQRFSDSMTLTRSDLLDEINGLFLNLFIFALAMSGLALLAGVMLVANIVSLGMMERRFEIGVMKAVGYSQANILTTLAIEYGLIGFATSIAALLGVQAMITLITVTQDAAAGILVMNPITALLIVISGVILTLSTALAAAWQPTRIAPLMILNQNV